MASLIPDFPKLQNPTRVSVQSFIPLSNGPANLAVREKPGRPVLHALLRGDEEINVEDRQLNRYASWLLPPRTESRELDSIPLPGVHNSLLLGFNGSDEGNRSPLVDSKYEVAVQPSPPPRQKLNNKEQNDYYVNLGSAIRTLREELPLLFSKDLSYDIYRDDITFTDPFNSVQGIDNYKLIFWALRFHGRIFFRAIWVDIVRVWQPSERVILIRWTLKGIPRVPWEAHGQFDGTSKYKLDKDGKIYEHHVDNLAFNFPQKLKTASVLDLVTVAGCPTSPTPTFFGGPGISHSSNSAWLEGTTWLQFYWAVKNTLDLEGAQLVYRCC
eukprot:Gb_20661 [translate_table: standard]